MADVPKSAREFIGPKSGLSGPKSGLSPGCPGHVVRAKNPGSPGRSPWGTKMTPSWRDQK